MGAHNVDHALSLINKHCKRECCTVLVLGGRGVQKSEHTSQFSHVWYSVFGGSVLQACRGEAGNQFWLNCRAQYKLVKPGSMQADRVFVCFSEFEL